MDTDPDVSDLVRRAAGGDQTAWDALVERYSPLVMSVIRRHRLDPDDAADTYQTVWLRLVEHVPRLREPRALPGWLVTTAQRECLRVLRTRERTQAVNPTDIEQPALHAANLTAANVDERLLQAERQQALLAAFAELPDHHRRLLALLLADPPLSYEEISRRLDVAVGYIGPTRSRALQRLRQSPHLAGLADHSRPTVKGSAKNGRTSVAR